MSGKGRKSSKWKLQIQNLVFAKLCVVSISLKIVKTKAVEGLGTI